MNYYLVCSQDGTILRTGACPDVLVADQAGEGEIALPLTAPINDADVYVDLADSEAPVLRAKPPRPSPFHYWQSGAWVGNLDAAQLSKNAELSSACRRSIEAELTSDALGTTHCYDYQAHDQQNLSDAKALWIDMLISCTDPDGVKQLRLHTPVQIDTVYRAGLAHRAACITRLSLLRSQLAKLDLPGVLALHW